MAPPDRVVHARRIGRARALERRVHRHHRLEARRRGTPSSEEGYALAMEASGDGHWDWDIVADTYHASPRMLELYGLPPDTTFENRADFLAPIPIPSRRSSAVGRGDGRAFRRRDGALRHRDPHRAARGDALDPLDRPATRATRRARRCAGRARSPTSPARKRVAEELRARQDLLDLAQNVARAVAFEWRIGAGEGENRWSPDLEAMYGLAPGSYDGTYESWKKLVYPGRLAERYARRSSRPSRPATSTPSTASCIRGGGFAGCRRRAGCSSIRKACRRGSSDSCSTSPIATSRRTSCGGWSGSCARRNGSKRWARSRAASRTTSTTCSARSSVMARWRCATRPREAGCVATSTTS